MTCENGGRCENWHPFRPRRKTLSLVSSPVEQSRAIRGWFWLRTVAGRAFPPTKEWARLDLAVMRCKMTKHVFVYSLLRASHHNLLKCSAERRSSLEFSAERHFEAFPKKNRAGEAMISFIIHLVTCFAPHSSNARSKLHFS